MGVIPENCKVALLAGGSSGEREISLLSGKGAHVALVEAGFTVEDIDPANKADLQKLLTNHYDVAFLALHGKNGEDGTIQGMLEILGIPYTGSGVLASALAMDKSKAKVAYREHGLPTPKAVVLEKSSKRSADGIADEVGMPCVVKPATDGSALGVSIVESLDDLQKAIDDDFALDTKVIIESYIQGTEITVAVLGNKNPHALPIIEIVPMNEFYDFDSKYQPGGAKHICPARLSDDMTMLVKKLAERAHDALGCRGVSRTDMIIDGEGEPWILETNTIPGMTATSLLPDAAKVEGMDFPTLCTRLIDLAFEEE